MRRELAASLVELDLERDILALELAQRLVADVAADRRRRRCGLLAIMSVVALLLSFCRRTAHHSLRWLRCGGAPLAVRACCRPAGLQRGLVRPVAPRDRLERGRQRDHSPPSRQATSVTRTPLACHFGSASAALKAACFSLVASTVTTAVSVRSSFTSYFFGCAMGFPPNRIRPRSPRMARRRGLRR